MESPAIPRPITAAIAVTAMLLLVFIDFIIADWFRHAPLIILTSVVFSFTFVGAAHAGRKLPDSLSLRWLAITVIAALGGSIEGLVVFAIYRAQFWPAALIMSSCVMFIMVLLSVLALLEPKHEEPNA